MSILGERLYYVRRYTSGVVTDHVRVPTVSKTFTVLASVQPLRGEELQLLPEGKRTKRTLKAYTGAKLQAYDEVDNTPGDEVLVDGEYFEVHDAKGYDDGILDHTKFLLVRRERT